MVSLAFHLFVVGTVIFAPCSYDCSRPLLCWSQYNRHVRVNGQHCPFFPERQETRGYLGLEAVAILKCLGYELYDRIQARSRGGR